MIGKALKYMRKERQLSQEDLSQILSVNQTTLSGWERNYREPTFNTIEKIAKICNYEIIFKNKINDDFFTIKDLERKDV